MPFLTRSLILYSGSDSLPAVDYTDDTDWAQVELGSTANLGEASAGQWWIRDEGGVIPDSMTPKKLLFAHNVVVVTVGSNTLFRGRVAEQQQFRGRQQAGRATERTITLEDQNSHLRGIVVHNWVRGAETDVARAQGLVASYLSGNYRVTTNLNGSNLIISSNLISLPAKTYSGVTPFEIMAELASNADKEFFVSIDNELAYFGHDYTGYASQLRVSDAGYPGGPDASATTYVPWNPRGTYAERLRLSALRVYYGSDVTQSTVRLTREGLYPDTDYWEEVFWDSESVTSAQASARATKMLDYRQNDDVAYSFSIGPMSGDEIYKIKPGHTIQFKSRAARAGRTSSGAYIGDSFMTTRIREIRWRTPAEDQYIADLQLERPKKTSFFWQRGSQALATKPNIYPTPSGCSGTETFTRSVSSGWGGTELCATGWTIVTGAGQITDHFRVINGQGVFDPNGLAGSNADIYVNPNGGIELPFEMTADCSITSHFSALANMSLEITPVSGVLQAADTTLFITHDYTAGNLRVTAAVDGPTISSTAYIVPGTSVAFDQSTDTLTNDLKLRWRVDSAGVKAKVWRAIDSEPVAWSVDLADPVSGSFLSLFCRMSGGGAAAPAREYWWDNLAIVTSSAYTVPLIYGAT